MSACAKPTVLLIGYGKANALRLIHRAGCQVATLAALEFDQDLLVVWLVKKKNTLKLSQRIPKSKVKHSVYLKMPTSECQAEKWHQDKSCEHCASVRSSSIPFMTFTERNKASCQHLLCERALSVQLKSWELQTSTPQCGQCWQRHVPKNPDWVQQLD